MFFREPAEAETQVTFGRALRHLVAFQIKLAADAVRDFIFSPVSIVVFILDSIRKPSLEDSLYVRLMLMGRRSDRFINLFDEHRDKGERTMDEAIETVERLAGEVAREIEQQERVKKTQDS